jgi:hypothetical protein
MRFCKKQPEQSKDKDLEKASVLFNLDISGNVDVQFLWPDTEVMTSLEAKDLAKNYSSLISIINLGGFKGDILKILMQSQKQTNCISDKIFISDVLKYLVDADNISSTSLPLISPTKVFKKYEQ